MQGGRGAEPEAGGVEYVERQDGPHPHPSPDDGRLLFGGGIARYAGCRRGNGRDRGGLLLCSKHGRGLEM